MKKHLTFLLLAALYSLSYSQPNISKVSFPETVDLFDLYEIAFQMGTYSNPYDPDIINVYAEFDGPQGEKHVVNAFYFEDYSFSKQDGYEKATPNTKNNGWRVRFTPTLTGVWQFSLHAIDRNGTTSLTSSGTKTFSFRCQPVKTGNGFITKANSKYLQRDIVKDGKRQNHSYFPIGPSVAWYTCKSYYDYTKPKGIYEYETYIDSLAGNANYMRIWLSRYQYLSLYGPEYTQTENGQPKVYFNSTINQKDAAEFDHIINYAAQHGITVMPCIFSFGDFKYEGTESKGPGKWGNNPYHTILGLEQPHEFFSDTEAIRITKNYIRYLIARWGYSPNVMSWELWNEVSNMDNDICSKQYQRKVAKWHNKMSKYIRSVDPFHHLITSSMGSPKAMEHLYKNMFKKLDIMQAHNYQNIDKAWSDEQFSFILYSLTKNGQNLYPDKPFFVGEFGFGSTTLETFKAKDPHAFDLHNSLWSSLFSGSMGPASFWYWSILHKCDLFRTFKPLLVFCNNMAIPSSSFIAHTTGVASKNTLFFPNNIETYYMINANEDTLYGWSQDTAFCYQSLRHLAQKGVVGGHFDNNAPIDTKGYLFTLSSGRKPAPSSKSNTITLPIEEQPIGTKYIIRWFNTETGLEIPAEKTTTTVKQDGKKKVVSFDFPSSIRDLKQKKINNTYGDAVFMLTLDRGQNEGNNASGTAPNNTQLKATRPD